MWTTTHSLTTTFSGCGLTSMFQSRAETGSELSWMLSTGSSAACRLRCASYARSKWCTSLALQNKSYMTCSQEQAWLSCTASTADRDGEQHVSWTSQLRQAWCGVHARHDQACKEAWSHNSYLSWCQLSAWIFCEHIVWPGLEVVLRQLAGSYSPLARLQLCSGHCISTVLQLFVMAATLTAPGTAASLQH